MPLLERLIYWYVLFNLGYFISIFSHKMTDWFFKNKFKNLILVFIAPSLLAAMPLSILVGYATVYVGDKLIFLAMEDHYVQVYTDLGNHMILMRMKDALSELEGFNGLQTHRSYWVASDAVVNARKESRKTFLVMSNGLEVPVSRKYLAAIKEAGLLSF